MPESGRFARAASCRDALGVGPRNSVERRSPGTRNSLVLIAAILPRVKEREKGCRSRGRVIRTGARFAAIAYRRQSWNTYRNTIQLQIDLATEYGNGSKQSGTEQQQAGGFGRLGVQ